jgi:cyclopropane-fatty-acyl-phospholipid synthase
VSTLQFEHSPETDSKYGGSKEGIVHHYDIGNEFWELMLGPAFAYSAALFTGPDDTLEAAQERKFRWHMASARVAHAKSVLEVGCGWGTLLHMISDQPQTRRIVGLTLSDAQTDYLKSLDLAKTEIRTENWAVHEPKETYDSIISIGAFEHFAKPQDTTEQNRIVYRDFFERCHRWLSPTGGLSLQTIAYGNMARKDASRFMNTEIYPESELPYLGEILEAIDGLFEPVAIRNDRFDYARSYDCWLRNLRSRRQAAVGLVGEEEVRRFERFYKLGSIGFRLGKIWLLRLALRPIHSSWAISGANPSWSNGHSLA